MALVMFFGGRRWALFVVLLAMAPALVAEPAPGFDLPRRGVEGRLRLEDFAGQILVLDFFAFWCAPCARASRELETGVQEHYAREGNSRGVPVRVVSVNIEADQPAQTDQFIRRTGASLVADDPAAELLKKFGAVNIPFLVVIDGTASRPGDARFEVVYRHAGFEGIGKLRSVIDGLGATSTESPSKPGPKDATLADRATRAPREHTFAAESEFARASDIRLTESALRYQQVGGGTEWEAAVAYATFDEDYRAVKLVDPGGFEDRLREDRIGGQLSLRQRVAEPFTLIGSLGFYNGYPDYRRVWIANRYRQKYGHPDFPTVPGYEEPDPHGGNGSLGLRWEYLPATGFAEFTLGYARDETAPGYEDGEDERGGYKLIQGRKFLDTRSLRFSSENVLAARLRTLNEFSFVSTSGRDGRFSYQGSLNLALGERWVVRGYGGVSTEAPQFGAHFFGATVECEIMPRWLLSLSGRHYEDTGEIENSLPFTSAAPPLRSWEAGGSIRYAGNRISVKASYSPFHTDYQRDPKIGPEFFRLYADRQWALAQIAFSVQF